MHKQILLLLVLLLILSTAQAFETTQTNPRVYAQVGDLGQRTPQNLSHNIASNSIIGENFAGTNPAFPNHIFDERLRLPLAGIEAEESFTGGGQTTSDSIVWLTGNKIAFTGDLVYVQRLLGVRENGDAAWINSLRPKVVIPGHDHVTDLDEALHDSHDYRVHLQNATQQQIKEGAFDPVEASQGFDQSRFSYLENYNDLRFRSINALRIAEELFETQ